MRGSYEGDNRGDRAPCTASVNSYHLHPATGQMSPQAPFCAQPPTVIPLLTVSNTPHPNTGSLSSHSLFLVTSPIATVLHPESPSFQPPKILFGPRLIPVTHSSIPNDPPALGIQQSCLCSVAPFHLHQCAVPLCSYCTQGPKHLQQLSST